MQPTSNGSKSIFKLTSLWYDKKISKLMNFRKLSLSGRGLTGTRILRTRGKLLNKLKLPVVAYNFRYAYPLLIVTFKLTPFYNKILTLTFLPSGGIAYLPTPARHPLFSLIYFKTPSSPWFSRKYTYLTFISLIQRHKKISNFELYPGQGIQYARSAGTWGKITTRDLKKYTALVYLPSGVRKIISIFSLVVPGRCAGMLKRSITNTKSGFYRTYGFKSCVRGVAMNPVDHPHGGRTKSIKYPRTPWGKTTKFK